MRWYTYHIYIDQRTGIDGEAALEPLDAQALQRGEFGDGVLDGGEGGEADVQHAQAAQTQQRLWQAVVCIVVLGRQAHLLRRAHAAPVKTLFCYRCVSTESQSALMLLRARAGINSAWHGSHASSIQGQSFPYRQRP